MAVDETKVTVSFTCTATDAVTMLAFYGILMANVDDESDDITATHAWTTFPDAISSLTDQARRLYSSHDVDMLSDFQKVLLKETLGIETKRDA